MDNQRIGYALSVHAFSTPFSNLIFSSLIPVNSQLLPQDQKNLSIQKI